MLKYRPDNLLSQKLTLRNMIGLGVPVYDKIRMSFDMGDDTTQCITFNLDEAKTRGLLNLDDTWFKCEYCGEVLRPIRVSSHKTALSCPNNGAAIHTAHGVYCFIQHVVQLPMEISVAKALYAAGITTRAAFLYNVGKSKSYLFKTLECQGADPYAYCHMDRRAGNWVVDTNRLTDTLMPFVVPHGFDKVLFNNAVHKGLAHLRGPNLGITKKILESAPNSSVYSPIIRLSSAETKDYEAVAKLITLINT